MGPTPEERAAGAIARYRESGDLGALEAGLAADFAEVVAEERRGLRTTLGLCAEVLSQVLALPNVPGDLRAAARVCHGFCLAGLGPEPDGPPAGGKEPESSQPG